MKRRRAGLAVLPQPHGAARVGCDCRWMSEPWLSQCSRSASAGFRRPAPARAVSWRRQIRDMSANGLPARRRPRAPPNPEYASERPARRFAQPAAPAQRDDDLAFCVAETNRYRERHGKAPLRRSAELEAYAATGARYDTAARTPHKHFDDTRGGNLAFAANECLSFHGWTLQFGGSVRGTIIKCLRTFYDEGPGGGHQQNMMGEYRTVGCGVHVAGGGVSIVQDFGR